MSKPHSRKRRVQSTRHASARWRERGITVRQVERALRTGRLIEVASYRNGRTNGVYWCDSGGRVLHVVVALPLDDAQTVITAYWPDEADPPVFEPPLYLWRVT